MRLAHGHRLPVALIALGLLAACRDEAEVVPEPVRPVRVTVAQSVAAGETIRLTGEIVAQDSALLGFRIAGRVTERAVNLGDTVEAGQLLARIDDATQANSVRAAEAALTAAEGEATRAGTDYTRVAQLLERGFATRQRYDSALQVYRQAQAGAHVARADLAIAREALGFTALYADAPGVVTAIGAEPGEVVAAGGMVVQVARNAGRDAVFDVPDRLTGLVDPASEIAVAAVGDPGVTARGRVREVSPQADPVTRTFRVRVGLSDVPAAMRLGSAVTGSVVLAGEAGTPLPAAALTTLDGRPAVFVVDPATGLVALREVGIGRFGIAEVQVAQGVQDGDVIVTAGVQALRPGQQVRVDPGR